MTQPINYWKIGDSLLQGYYPPNTESWFSKYDTDTEENFKEHQTEGWAEYSFSYKYNSYGFRSREFNLDDPKPKILGLGCSNTLGVGIPFKDTWVEQFGKELSDYVVYNAGLGGASSDTIARVAINLIPIIKPDIVAILWPNMHRFESYSGEYLITNPEDANFFKKSLRFNGPWNADDFKFHFEDNNAFNNQTKNKVIVDLLKEIYKFKLIELDLDSEKYNGLNFPKARDNLHHGCEWHTEVSKDFYNEYLKIRVLK